MSATIEICGHLPGLAARRVSVDLVGLRFAGAAMLAAGYALPLLGHPGPGCLLRAATGIPCPLCGMSTSVQDAVRLNLEDALASNPAGIAAVVASLVLLVNRRPKVAEVPAWAIAIALGGMWMYQMIRFSVL